MIIKYLLAVLLIFQLGTNVFAASALKSEVSWKFVDRSSWGARPRNGTKETFGGPAPFIIIHHSYIPPVAYTRQGCIDAMKFMQDLHMDTNGWRDIGYTYAICGDGDVYEGVGYNVVGRHAPNYNDRSIGLLLIGDYVEQLPTPTMLAVAHDFIDYSVKNGYLHEDYILYGHRQVRATECPGAALYAEIQTWPHWREVQKPGTTNAVECRTALTQMVFTISLLVLFLCRSR